MTARRVVVTGIGLVTPFGVGFEHNWRRILEAGVAVTGLQACDNVLYSQIPSKVVARVPEELPQSNEPAEEGDGKEWRFDFSRFAKEKRQMSRGIAFGVAAAEEAIANSGVALSWAANEELREESGVCFGMGMADLDDVFQTGKLLESHKYRSLSPYFVPRILTNMAAGMISMRFGLRGPNHSVATACTTGAHSIGDAFEMIRRGKAKVNEIPMLPSSTQSVHTRLCVPYSSSTHVCPRHGSSCTVVWVPVH